MNQAMKRDTFFWLIVSCVVSVLMVYYLVNENTSLLPLGFSPLVAFVGFLVGANKKKRENYSITKMSELVIVNSMFLCFFVGSLLLKPEYQVIKIGMFIVFSTVGTYNTIYFFKDQTK